MKTISSIVPRKEYVFFDLARCINELYVLYHELSAQDIDEIKNAYKKLRYFIKDEQPQLNLA
ncbi:hypothetical protein [Legionella pneumophila]|uniref:hypothetical protein n=1 Tax=Legionella pneumophila TaxID=446 RepID=UPI00077077D9|nr:hypothetical protein [Legionella pneumophila]CZL26994.1 Uncharacterised protein [Legionella pneumophila]